MDFELVSEITDIETIAAGTGQINPLARGPGRELIEARLGDECHFGERSDRRRRLDSRDPHGAEAGGGALLASGLDARSDGCRR